MEKKVKIPKSLFGLPWAQTILGTHLEGRVNFMALDWLTRVNYEPAMLGICVNKRNASHGAIVGTGEFSVNVPGVDMLEETDYTGLVSGARTDKSGLFGVFYGEVKAAPLIRDCPINIECRVSETIDLPTNSFFIAEMVNIYSEERYLTDGSPDAMQIEPFVLTMPDNRYWAVGGSVGKAWSAGKAVKERLKGEG